MRPSAPTSTVFACADGCISGASAAGTRTYVPGDSLTVKRPSASERKVATRRLFWRTSKDAAKGASHGTFTWHTGVTGPRTTVPVSPVVSATGLLQTPANAPIAAQRDQRLVVVIPGKLVEHGGSSTGAHALRPIPPVSYRRFTDGLGREWEVWEVVPASVERRDAEAPEPPASGDRRRRHESRVRMPAKLRDGWLAFQCKHEQRRLAPIPGNWSQASDADLLALLAEAAAHTRPRRLIE